MEILMLTQPDDSIWVFSVMKEGDLHQNNMFVLALFIFLILSVQTQLIIKKNFSYMAHEKSQTYYNGWHISRGNFQSTLTSMDKDMKAYSKVIKAFQGLVSGQALLLRIHLEKHLDKLPKFWLSCSCKGEGLDSRPLNSVYVMRMEWKEYLSFWKT